MSIFTLVSITGKHEKDTDIYFNDADYIQPSEEFCNSCGEYLDAYVESLKEASNIWSVPVIDTHALKA